MKIRRARYQKGSIRRVSRANDFAWEVRFSEYLNGKRLSPDLYALTTVARWRSAECLPCGTTPLRTIS